MIAGTAEFLGDLPPEDPRRADMEVISQESHRVADLVRRLLGLVRAVSYPAPSRCMTCWITPYAY